MLEHLWTSFSIRTVNTLFCFFLNFPAVSSVYLFMSMSTPRLIHLNCSYRQVGLIIVSSLYFTAFSVQPAVFINVLIINTCQLSFRVILSCGQNGQTT